MARHCFEVHVAFDIGERGVTADVVEDVEERLAEARDGLVLLQADLGGRGDLAITVEDSWPVGDTGSTQPLVEEIEADGELMAKLRRRKPDTLDEALEQVRVAVTQFWTEVGDVLDEARREGGS